MNKLLRWNVLHSHPAYKICWDIVSAVSSVPSTHWPLGGMIIMFFNSVISNTCHKNPPGASDLNWAVFFSSNSLTYIPGPWFNIKMSSYQYRKSHCGDKTVVRSSYLHNGISYTGKMTSLYWISPQDLFIESCPQFLFGLSKLIPQLAFVPIVAGMVTMLIFQDLAMAPPARTRTAKVDSALRDRTSQIRLTMKWPYRKGFVISGQSLNGNWNKGRKKVKILQALWLCLGKFWLGM